MYENKREFKNWYFKPSALMCTLVVHSMCTVKKRARGHSFIAPRMRHPQQVRQYVHSGLLCNRYYNINLGEHSQKDWTNMKIGRT